MVVLAPLVELSGLLVALGLIALAVVLVAALFKTAEATVGWIPWLGQKAKGGLEATRKRLVNHMSLWVVGIEGQIASTWHLLGNLIEQTGEAIWDATRLAAHAVWLYEVQLPIQLAKLAAATAEHAGQKAWARTQPVVKNYYTTKGISAKQFRDLLKKVTTLGLAVAALRAAQAHAPSLPHISAPALPQSLRGIRSRLSHLEHRFGRKAFAASVATALGVLGLSWTRRSCTKRNNDLLCASDFDMLEGLLGGLLLILSSVSLLDLTRGVQEITDEVVGAVRSFIREASALDDGNAPPRSVFGIDGKGEATALGFGVTPSVQRFGIDG